MYHHISHSLVNSNEKDIIALFAIGLRNASITEVLHFMENVLRFNGHSHTGAFCIFKLLIMLSSVLYGLLSDLLTRQYNINSKNAKLAKSENESDNIIYLIVSISTVKHNK